MVSIVYQIVFIVFALESRALGQCISREAVVGAGMPGVFGGPWAYDGIVPYDVPYGPGWSPAGFGAGFAGFDTAYGFEPTANYGGGLAVTSTSPIAPTGLTVTSENTIEGMVGVSGQLPFLGAIATDGVFPTTGAGSVTYGCGDGAVGIVAEAPIAPATYGYGPALGAAYNGLSGPVGYGGCGYSPLY